MTARRADGAYGLWTSSDSGATFRKLRNVEEADTIGFGKPAPGHRSPALYTSARIDGVRGIFRSDSAGRRWVRVNDDEHQYAWTGNAITGDPRVYGRVYVSTNGRGVVYGEPGAGRSSPFASTRDVTRSGTSRRPLTPSAARRPGSRASREPYFTRRTAVGLTVGPPSSPPAGFVPAPSAGSLAIGGRS